MTAYKNTPDDTCSQNRWSSAGKVLLGALSLGCIIYAIYAAIFCNGDSSPSANKSTMQNEFEGCLPKQVRADGTYVFVCHVGTERFELPGEGDYSVTIEIVQP